MENPYLKDCNPCKDRCDGISKGKYIFENDTAFSEKYENEIIEMINKYPDKIASKSKLVGYPDIEVKNKAGEVIFYMEIKIQRRTFMAVTNILPNSNLIASETIALNLSDLERYFKIKKEINKKILIVWGLKNRPCIVEPEKTIFFYQEVNILENLYKQYGLSRRFRRKSGEGDVINGEHKGVVVNYHFSLNELLPLEIHNIF